MLIAPSFCSKRGLGQAHEQIAHATKLFNKTNKTAAKTKCLLAALPLAILSTQASAFSFTDFKSVGSAIAAMMQADHVTAALDTVNAQTAQTPKDIGERNLEVEANRMAVEDGKKHAQRIVETLEESRLGHGVTRNLDCEVIEEQKQQTVRQEVSSQAAYAMSASNAARYFTSEGHKRALRAKDHYTNYCDITEVAQGNCLAPIGPMSGADVNYSNINQNLTLTTDQRNAAHSYIKNIIDPAKTDASFCDNVQCKKLAENEAQYQTMGSLIQSAFIKQINDSTAFERPPAGAVTVEVEQLGELSAPWDGRLAAWDPSATNEPGAYEPGIDLPIPANMQEAVQVLAKSITHGEAGNANAYNRGQACGTHSRYHGDGGITRITEMTPQQILDRYNTNRNSTYKKGNVDCKIRLFAVGLYQFVPATLNGLLKIYPEYRHRPFTEEVQHKFGLHLMMHHPAVKKLISGQSDNIDEAQYALAKVWSSIGVPVGYVRRGVKGKPVAKTGFETYYSGNRANVTSTKMVRAALENIVRLNKQQGN